MKPAPKYRGSASRLAWIGLLLTFAARGQAAGLPVVFVPGTSGSQLLEVNPDGSKVPFWIAPSLLERGAIEKAKLGPGGVDGPTKLAAGEILKELKLRIRVAATIEAPGDPRPYSPTPDLFTSSPPTYPVYSGIAHWAKEALLAGGGGWYEAPYDWRKGACEENAEAIDAVVARALRETGRSQVILLAHSLGGLVCRDYLCRGDNAAKVRALIAVGTPWLGAPKAARGLRWGYHFGLGFRFDPSDTYTVRRVYIYYPDEGGKPVRVPYHSLVSLLDPDKTRAVARTLPCVFQQLPDEAFMEVYGRACGGASASVFLGDTPRQTHDSFRRENPDLYDDARGRLREILDGKPRGVPHYLIAATCDPRIGEDLRMDMRFTRERDGKLQWFQKPVTSVLELGRGLAPDWNKSSAFIAHLGQSRLAFTRELVDEFFDLNPLLRDVGNKNWHYTRILLLNKLRDRAMPLYQDDYVAVDTDVAWGDGTSPLLSATAGAVLRAGGKKDESAAVKWLGDKVTVEVVDPLGPVKDEHGRAKPGQFHEHSSMMDEDRVRELIRSFYREVGDPS
jgi:pimeloyl-ACP methyl ester carboxylesterase